jgi:predicted amidohydrolase
MARIVKVAAARMGPNNEGIIHPLGQVVARAATTGDELVAARIDLDQMIPARTRGDFVGRRHPEPYRLVTQPVRRAR